MHHSIDSEHNLKVVGWVADEIPGSEYSRADVKSEFSVFAELRLFSPIYTQKCYRLTVKPWPDVQRSLNTTSVCDDQGSRRYVFLPI
jgi:hypothetical protein